MYSCGSREIKMNANQSDEELLQIYVAAQRRNNIPAITYIFIVVLFGIVGNSATAKYYSSLPKTATNLLIKVLSINDLLTSLINIGGAVYLFFEGVFRITFLCLSNAVLTKIFFQNSLYLLVLIGLYRYFHICRPQSSWNLTVRRAKWCLVALFLFSSVNGCSYFAVYDIVVLDVCSGVNRTVCGHFCKPTAAKERQQVIKVFHVVDTVLAVASIIALLVLYSLIWRRVATRKQFVRKQSANLFKNPQGMSTNLAPDSEINEARTTETLKPAMVLEDQDVTVCEYSNKDKSKEVPMGTEHMQNAATESSKVINATKRNEESKTSPKPKAKVTLTMAMVSLASVLSFVPYIIGVFAYQRRDSGFRRILFRSFMLNSSVNPFVIWIFNKDFKMFIRRLFNACCRKRK